MSGPWEAYGAAADSVPAVPAVPAGNAGNAGKPWEAYASAAPSAGATGGGRAKIDAYLAETDRIVGLPAGTSARQIQQESGFNPQALNKGSQAAGLAQVIPSTLASLSKRFGRQLDPYNPDDALLMHREVMRENKAHFKTPEAALRAYNSGWTPADWNNPETNNYVRVVLGSGRNMLAAGRDLAAGAVRGAGSIGATLLAPVDAAARAMGVQNSVIGRTDRREAMTGALGDMGADTDSTAFGAGKIGAEVAGTLGVGGGMAAAAGAIPRVAAAVPNALLALGSSGMQAGAAAGKTGLALRTGGGALAGGASAALVDPDAAAIGAVTGGALPGALKLAGAAGDVAGNMLRPSVRNPELAKKAIEQYGIPLGPANITDSRTARALRSVLNDAPVIGGVGEAQGKAVQGGFNRAVGRTFGEDLPSLTPEVMDAARQRMGGEFERLWGGNALVVDRRLAQDITAIVDNAKSKLKTGQAAELENQVRSLLEKANQSAQIDGQFANNWQSELRMVVDSEKGLHKEMLGRLRAAVLSAFGRGLAPADAAALTANAKQYRAFKTVEPLINSAEAGVAGREVGDVPAGLLPQAVRGQYGSGIAQSPFADLTQIGSQYVADRIARTGGSTRAMVQNSLLGSALGVTAFHNPLVAAGVLPAAYGANALLGSPAAGRLMVASSPNRLQQLLSQLRPNDDLSQLGYRAAPVLNARR